MKKNVFKKIAMAIVLTLCLLLLSGCTGVAYCSYPDYYYPPVHYHFTPPRYSPPPRYYVPPRHSPPPRPYYRH